MENKLLNSSVVLKPILYGILASAILLSVYFVVLFLISGRNAALSQFYSFWYFIVSLAVGFGVQIGLYFYLKRLIKNAGGKMLGVTGATSTAAMISCCSHYLANLLPIIGVAGAIAVIAQYQIELFWLGILFNLAGIAYLTGKILKFKRSLIVNL